MAAAVPSLIFLLAQGVQQFSRQLNEKNENTVILLVFSALLISINLQHTHSRSPESRGAEAWDDQ